MTADLRDPLGGINCVRRCAVKKYITPALQQLHLDVVDSQPMLAERPF